VGVNTSNQNIIIITIMTLNYSYLTGTPLLFTFVVIVCWSVIVVVVVTAISSDDDCFRARRPILTIMESPASAAAASTIPTSFVVPHFVSLSTLSSYGRNSNIAIIGGGSRKYHLNEDVPPRYGSIQRRRPYHLFSMRSDDDQGNNNNANNDHEPNQTSPTKNNDDELFEQKEESNNSQTYKMVVIDELSWRVAKVRLEEANTKRFLNRKPLKMSYYQSRQFIQRNWGPIRTKKEFEDLVSNGDLKTPYISKRPEEYYGRRGEWISWEHYLLGEECSSDRSSSSSNSNSICNNSVSSDNFISDETNGHGRQNNSTDTDASSGKRQDVVLKWQ
jgi:hypothetical protein